MILALTFILLQIVTPTNNSITKNGMTVEWTFKDENQINFKLTSPSNGWVAIGLNTKKQLVGSNLIMVGVSEKHEVISDRYIISIGNHQSIEDLGGKASTQLLSAKNDNGGTTVEFTLSTKATDAYHLNLEKGKKIHLIMAYSHDDDFMHHSAMRTSLEIIL